MKASCAQLERTEYDDLAEPLAAAMRLDATQASLRQESSDLKPLLRVPDELLLECRHAQVRSA